jgi:hypothetical protein
MAQVVYTRVKYFGEFNLKAVQNTVMGWFTDNGFLAHEKNYTQKGDEIEIWIDAERDRSEYVRDIIELKFHYWSVTPTKKNESGDQLYTGRALLQTWAKTEVGYEDFYGDNKFDDPKSPWKARLFKLYENHILKRTLEFEYEDVLFYDTHKLINAIKKTYGMEFDTLRDGE